MQWKQYQLKTLLLEYILFFRLPVRFVFNGRSRLSQINCHSIQTEVRYFNWSHILQQFFVIFGNANCCPNYLRRFQPMLHNSCCKSGLCLRWFLSFSLFSLNQNYLQWKSTILCWDLSFKLFWLRQNLGKTFTRVFV